MSLPKLPNQFPHVGENPPTPLRGLRRESNPGETIPAFLARTRPPRSGG